MKELIKRPQIMEEAAQSKKGMIWILEILVFLLVAYIGQVLQGLVLVVPQTKALYSSPAYQAAIQSGDVTAAMEASVQISQQLTQSDWFMILNLFSNILMIGVVFIFCRFIQKRKLRTLGFVNKDVFKSYGIGMILGFVFFAACVGLGILTGGLTMNGLSDNFTANIWVLYLLGFMVQGMAEEVLCRGYFMSSFARRYPVWVAVGINALVFACMHLANPGIGVLPIINLFLFGVFASLYYVRGGNIWGIGAFHTVWNFAQGNVFGIQVSGLTVTNSLLSITATEGKPLLNGGSFGMEGSLICTLVYVAGIVWLLTRKNKDEVEESKKIAAQA